MGKTQEDHFCVLLQKQDQNQVGSQARCGVLVNPPKVTAAYLPDGGKWQLRSGMAAAVGPSSGFSMAKGGHHVLLHWPRWLLGLA